MKANSTSAKQIQKPRPDFPLFPHQTGRWAKKVRGKFQFFGSTLTDPKGQAALNLWLDQKDDLLAGRQPRVHRGDGFTVRDLCNRFLTAKQQQLDTGEIANRTWHDYKATTDRLITEFGKSRLVEDLATEDFEALRASIAKTRGHVSLGNEIQRIRTVFRYGYDSGLIAAPMRFGPLFKRPSKKVVRIARAKQGEKMFEAKDIQQLLELATPRLKAMILLAVNCGFGNNDCATLHMRALDLDGGWIDFPRPKTGVHRRCPLWPETVEALRLVLEKRKAPKDADHAENVFVTLKFGSYARDLGGGPVSKEFAKIVKTADLEQTGRGFYALRHTFRTIADGSRDQPACDHIMCHSRDDMASVYRERIDDDRLRAVADHVRAWLFPKEEKAAKTFKSSRGKTKPE